MDRGVNKYLVNYDLITCYNNVAIFKMPASHSSSGKKPISNFDLL